MKNKFIKIFWVLLLVISSFTLGYTLKPSASNRSMPAGMGGQTMGGGMAMPQGQSAPPFSFRRQ